MTPLPWTELGSGEPIGASARAWFEARFNIDFSAVRLHRGPVATAVAGDYSAQAFTYGSHIVLGHAVPSLESVAGRFLFAHELTHVVQQAGPYAEGLVSELARPRGPPSIPNAIPLIQRVTGLGVQCLTTEDVENAVVDFGAGALDTATDLGSSAVAFASQGFEAAVDFFAPGLLTFIRGGYLTRLTDLFCSGIDALVGSLISPLESIDFVSAIEQTFTSITEGVNSVRTAIGSTASAALGTVLRPLVEALQVYGDPIIHGIATVADTVDDVFSGLWQHVAVPVLDFLGSVGGEIWTQFNAFVTWIEEVTEPLQRAAAWAWNELCQQFNLAWNSTSGIRQWLSDKAQEAWRGFQELIEPIRTPLEIVGGTLLLLSPFGPIIIVTQVLPPLYERIVWLWNNWNTDDILVRAREILAHDILPAIIGTVSTVSSAISGAVSWLAGLTSTLSQQFGGVLAVFGANHCLEAVTRVLNHVADQFTRLAAWADGGFQGLGAAVTAVFDAIVAIVEPILDFLVRVIMVAANPPLLPIAITAAIWLLCPDELKPPVIDFVIDLLIQCMRVLSNLFMSLWPLNTLLKEAAIGFLEEIRGNGADDTARKIAVSNKLASLCAGAGVRFAAGFAVGILEGILDGILDPFRIIIMIVELVARVCSAIGNFVGPLIMRVSPTAGGYVNEYRTSLGAAPFTSQGIQTTDATADSGTLEHRPASAAPEAGAPAPTGSEGTAETTGPPPEVTEAIARYRAAAIASAQYARPAPRAYSHRTVPSPTSPVAAPTDTPSTGSTAPIPSSTEGGVPAAPMTGTLEHGPPSAGSATAEAALMQDETLASIVGPGPLPTNAEVVATLSTDDAADLAGAGSELTDAGGGSETSFSSELETRGSSPRSLSQVLGDMWESALTGAANLGARVAQSLMEFILLPDFQLGRKIGYVAGFVLFQVILAYLTAGVSAEAEAASPILRAVVRFLDLGGEILGLLGRAVGRVTPMIMRFLRPVGRFFGRFHCFDAIINGLTRALRALTRFGEHAVGAIRRVTDPLGAAAMRTAGISESAIARVMTSSGRHVAGDIGGHALARDARGAAAHDLGSAASHEGSAVGRTERDALGDTAERGTADDARRTGHEGGEPNAAGREASEADEAASLARRKEAELPLAMAQMSAFCMANDTINTPKDVLIPLLYATFREPYPWIRRFFARSLPVPHHYVILFEASPPIEIDGNYSDENPLREPRGFGQGRHTTAGLDVGEDVAAGELRVVDTPGGAPPPRATEIGNFAHENAEMLPRFAEDILPPDRLPRGLRHEYPIRMRNGDTLFADRVDLAEGIVYEIKPNTGDWARRGQAQAQTYAARLDQIEPLGSGRRWRTEVVLYDMDELEAWLVRIGYLEPDPATLGRHALEEFGERSASRTLASPHPYTASDLRGLRTGALDDAAEQASLGMTSGGSRYSVDRELRAEYPELYRRRGRVRRFATGPAPGPTPPIVHQALHTPGRPLDTTTRETFEPQLRTSLAQVRVHTGPVAARATRAINARAYAAGSDLVFGRGEYAPHTSRGQHLLAHELAHVAQQARAPAPDTAPEAADSRAEREAENFAAGTGTAALTSAAPGLRRQPVPTDDQTDQTTDDATGDGDFQVIEEEMPKWNWIDYPTAVRRNRLWFELLSIDGINPFAPYDPFLTPIAFTNHVAQWQLGAKKAQLAELVFAAQNQQNQDSLDKIAAGVAEVNEKAKSGKSVSPGNPMSADGVLGAQTLWVMLAAAAAARTAKARTEFQKAGVDTGPLEKLQDDRSAEWGAAWRAVNAELFNPAKFVATWPVLTRSDVVFDTFEKMVGLGPGNRATLEGLFFPDGVPTDPELKDEDFIAILSRGYTDQALDGAAFLFEVDRGYFHDVDIQKLVRKKRPDFNQNLDLRMGYADWGEVQKLIARLTLEIPQDPKAQGTFTKLQGQTSSGPGLLTKGNGALAVMAVVFALPDHDPQFWKDTAEKYVKEKKALADSAEQATQEHLAALQKKYEDRMAGEPDIKKADAMAFLELLVGETFASAQSDALDFQTKDAAKHDVEIIGKTQNSTSSAKAAELFTKAQKEGFLIVQLGDKAESKFPLPFQGIEQARKNAATNGKHPLPFDLIDTPHSAMHMYIPSRFSARETEDGASEAAQNPYELTWDSSKPQTGSGHAWENWHYFITRDFAAFDPVLVEIRQFNPDAGFFVKTFIRQTGITHDKVVMQYVWTLGGSLPALSKQLWDAQGTIDLFGWIDAGLTIFALASIVAAPLIAAADAATTTAAAELGEQAINAALRKALVEALKKFVIQEAIGEGLGRLTYYINDDPDVPTGLKKVWNGLMFAVLIYGIGQTVKQGIKGFRGMGSGKFRAEFAALEAELDAEAKVGAGTKGPSLAEQAAEADVKQRTKEKFSEATGDAADDPNTGPGRVRTDDPRAGDTMQPSADPADATAKLSAVLGEDALKALADKAKPETLKRLAALGDDGVIKKLVEALTPELLDRVLGVVGPETLKKLAQKLEGPALKLLLDAFAGSAAGVDLLHAFSADPARLSTLLDSVGAKRLLALSSNPGADKFARTAARVDPAALADTLQNIAAKPDTQLARFRQLINDLGPEGAADVMNTYTGKEIGSAARWKPKDGMSAAQNLQRLAIQRGEPTQARAASGIPITPAPVRAPRLLAGDFKAFFAIGPEATTPATVRRLLAMVQEASAKAANRLSELIERSAAGTLTDADLQALPPNARATVEAFLKAGSQDGNRAALYGSALQYLAEGEIRAANGGNLPPGVAFRRPEVKGGKTLIPDAQVELTMDKELRNPDRNKTERAVIDWTTAGEAGKITKYRGGKPPVTVAVEVIQPGPPPAPPAATNPIIVKPHLTDPPPDTDTTDK